MSENQIHELENAVLERCHPHGAVVHVWVDKKSPVVCILSVYSLSILSQYSPVYSLSSLTQYSPVYSLSILSQYSPVYSLSILSQYSVLSL